MERPLIAILDNKDQLLCVTDDYFDGNLHRFLQGTAAFFRCSILQNSELSQYFVVGNKISFFYNATAFHFDITDMVKDEEIVTIQADSLTLELRNEQIPAYKATKAMSFEEYLKVFLFTGDNPLVMGINEVSNKKLQLEWEAEDSNIMSRLFSLATKFDAEIEFVTRLNQHWGLLDIVLNVFVANSDKYQGIGNNRQDIILELGNNVETIEIHENIDDLKTAIKPIGKDGLLITNVVIDEKDADGNRLFYSPKGDAHIRAVQAKNQFISKVNGEGYISYPWEYDTENENVLAGQGLAELKKRAKVTLTVTVKGFDKTLQIGDTVRVLNEAYNPSLNMTMRVSELDIYFDKPSNDSGVFTNAQILQSEVDTTLLTRVQALIEANKVFTYEIITSDGVTFKNGFGSTTLTARVRDGIKDVTDTFSLKWYKDGTLFSNTKTVTINAADIEEKAVFRFEVADDSGNVRGGAEVTVTNIDDGKKGEPGETYYPHRGYLMADGTFTKVYPNENELPNSKSPVFLNYLGSTVTTEIVSVSEWGATDAVKHTVSGGTNATIAGVMRSGTTVGANNPYVHSIYVKNTGTSYVRLNNNLGQTIDVYPGETKRVVFNSRASAAGTAAKQFVLYRLDATVIQEFIVWHAKIEKSQDTATIWTPTPDEDYENAYPKYEGFYSDTNQVGSDNPDDYKPWTPFMGPQGGQGPKGDSAPLISLSGATQAITVDKDGKITPASSFAVTGTAVNTTISNWTYSLNGGNFGSAVPTGVTRSGNTVTINPVTATFDTFTIKAADATVSDVFTISRIKDGGEGPPGADAYTVFLTNESYTFAGSTTAALAGSTTTEVIVYKGINKITPTSITVGTKPTGLSSSVSGSIITLTATTALVSKSGTVPITIVADGKTFTKQFAYSISFQGGKGDTGDTGKGVAAEEISYAISQDGTTPPTSGWSGTRPTPKAGWYMWTRTRFKYTDNTYSAYFYLVAQQGKDAIIISATPPTNPSKEDLWQDPNDATSTVYKWDGTQWIRWGISIDNLIVSNVQIENGVFKRVEGALIVGSEFRNPYTVTYNDGSVSTGTVVMEGSAITNSGVNKTSNGVRRYAYEDAWSPGNLTMSRYDDDKVGDQNKLLAALGLTYNRLTLTDLQTGFAGSLTAEMLFDTGYVSLPILKGSGAIRVRRYMGRYMIWFDTFIWNGSGGGGIGDAVIQLPAEFNPGRQQMLEVPIWSTAPGRVDRFQLNTDGRLYKLSNNSGGTYFRTFTEIF